MNQTLSFVPFPADVGHSFQVQNHSTHAVLATFTGGNTVDVDFPPDVDTTIDYVRVSDGRRFPGGTWVNDGGIPLPDDEDTVYVLFLSGTVGEPQNGIPIDITLDESGPVSLNGRIESNRVVHGETADIEIGGQMVTGACLLKLRPASVLAGGGYLDTYSVSLPTLETGFRIRVKDADVQDRDIWGMRVT